MVNMFFCMAALVLFTIGFRLVKRGNPFRRGGGDTYTQRRMYRMLGWMLWTTAGALVMVTVIDQLSSDGLTDEDLIAGSGQSTTKSGAETIRTVMSKSQLIPNLLHDPSLQADGAESGVTDAASRLALSTMVPHTASSMVPSLVKPLPEDLPAADRASDPADNFAPKMGVPAPALAASSAAPTIPDAVPAPVAVPTASLPAPAQDITSPVAPVRQPLTLDPVKLKVLDAEVVAADAIVQKSPGSVVGYLQRGNAYGNEFKWDLAKRDYLQALQLDGRCTTAAFNMAELDFMQSKYDEARPGFLALINDHDVGDLAKYNAFLCDLFAGHEQTAAKELAVFNDVGSEASYYFANVAWCLYHKKTDDAQNWWQSANGIFTPGKVNLYAKPLIDLGYINVAS